MTSIDVVKTTIALEEPVHRALRHLAIDDRVSVQNMMARAVREMVERRTGQKFEKETSDAD
jgi:predicted transcriptional regulator